MNDTLILSSERIKIYPATRAQMEDLISGESDAELKKAYCEMLDGCLSNPSEWDWYAAWMIETLDGTHIGDLCFKGLSSGEAPEIGYGILKEFEGQGYATEAVKLALKWAFGHSKVNAVEAETEPDNAASQKVLKKCGFSPKGETGKEGPRFIVKKEAYNSIGNA